MNSTSVKIITYSRLNETSAAFLIWISGVLLLSGCGDAAQQLSVQSQAALEQDAAQANNYHVYTGDAARICKGEKFINKNRVLSEGTRRCDTSVSETNLSNLTAANIRSGVTIGGIVGTMQPSPGLCGANLTQNCVASGTFHAAQSCLTSGSSGCYVPHYALTTQPLMAVDIDDLDTTKVRNSLTIAGRAGSLSDCATNGLSGCVTTMTYKSADLTNLSAGNIKTGVNIAGTVGTYPSVATPLVTNTATADLTSVNPTTATGSYEFFDSAGVAYEMTLADGGTITPSSNQQILGAAGTFYRGAIISALNSAPATCSASGTQGCLVSGSFYAATACSANSSNCYLPTYSAGTQPLLAINYDNIDSTKMRAALTIGSKTGTLPDCTSDGGAGCVVVGPSYAAAATTNIAPQILTGSTIAGISGTATAESHPNCSSDGALGCVTTSSFRAADMTVALPSNILTNKTIAGVAGNVTAEFHNNCSANGTQGCIASGSFYAGTACSANSSNCYLPTYSAGTQPLLAINYDNIDSTKMRAALTIAGKSGNLGDCSTDGATGCVTVTDYPAAKLANFAAGNIQSGIAIAGVNGSLANCATDGALGCVTVTGYPSAKLNNFTASNVQSGTTIAGVSGMLANCSADGGTGCVAVASFTAAATTGLASKVLSATTVAGVAGNVTLPAGEHVLTGTQYGVAGTGSVGTLALPAAGSVLTGTSYGVSGTGSTGTLTLPTAANVRSVNGAYGIGGNGTTPTLADCSTDGTLGCVTVTGFPSANLANFTAARVQSGTTIAGVAGTIASCTVDGQTGCTSSALLPAANISGFSTWNLRAGTTLAGLGGTLKTNCRNTVNSATYNYDGNVSSLGTGIVVTGTQADYWDTIDDYNGFPSTRVALWSTDTYCDSTTWADKTTTNGGSLFTTCGTSSTCIYQDKISNLQVTGILASGGNTTNTTTPGQYAWNTAVQICNSSTYGGYTQGSWRLPTQKELLSLYEHGIVSLMGTSFITGTNLRSGNNFWSATTSRSYPDYAWYGSLITGTSSYTEKITNSKYVICVR